MIYTSYFENRVGDIIQVYFDTQEQEEVISSSDLTVTDTSFCSEVYENMMFYRHAGTNAVTIQHSLLDRNLCVIRLFKGKEIEIAKSRGSNAMYVVTDLRKKIAIEYGNITNTNSFSYTPSNDGYLLINIVTTTPVTLVGRTTRQRTDDRLIFSDNPITINNNSDGIYAPLKLSSATVRVMTRDVLLDMYSTKSQGVKCIIKNYDTNTTLFFGYVTPCIYSQDYTSPYEELEIECVSPFSTLEYKKYRTSQDSIVSWYEIIKGAFEATGYYNDYCDSFVLQMCYEIEPKDEYWIKGTYINQEVFEDGKDDDGVIQYLDYKTILSNFCTTFGLSLCEINGQVFFLDFASLDEDTTFLKWVLDDDTTEVYNLPSTDDFAISYNASDQNITFDDLYGKINVSAKIKTTEKNILVSDDDNLICLHPNVPYLSWESREQENRDWFTDMSGDWRDRQHDVYRFYIYKNCKHYYYHSYFNPSNNTYGLGIQRQFTTTTIANLSSSDENTVKNAIESFLRSNVCCLVVKHFSFREFSYKEKTPELKWDTKILYSYGLGNVHFRCDVNFDLTLSQLLRDHYKSTENKTLIETKESYSFIPMHGKNNYINLSASVYFMNYPLFTDCNYYNSDNVKKYSSTNVRDSWCCNWGSTAYSLIMDNTILSVGLNKKDNTTQWLKFSYNYQQYNDAMWYGADLETTGDNLRFYEMHKAFLYNTHSQYDNITYDMCLSESKGQVILTNDYYTGTVKIGMPMPFNGQNNIVANFAMVSGVELKMISQYNVDEVLLNKINDDDKKYSLSTTYNDFNDYDIQMPYITQPKDKNLSINSLMYIDGDGEINYLYNDINYRGNYLTVEDIILNKYYNHHKEPKLIYQLSFEGRMWPSLKDYNVDALNSSNILKYPCAGSERTMIIDSIEYDVYDASKNVKLIEK